MEKKGERMAHHLGFGAVSMLVRVQGQGLRE